MERYAKILVLFAALTESAICQRSPSDILSDKQTLAGQLRMAVAIDMVSLPGYTFRPDVENALREAGITILPSTDRAPAFPMLRVGVTGTVVNRFQPPQLSYHIGLELIQLLPFGTGKYVKATTWSSNRSGIVAWNGIISSSEVVEEVRKNAMTMLNDFLEDWREVNSGAAPSRVEPPLSRLFDGVWRGSYSCTGGFGGGGQSTWTIREARPGRVEVVEQWVRFLTGRNTYTGAINGDILEVRTNDMGGYSVTLRLSSDQSTLAGRYSGHPNQCQTITLRKTN